MHLEIALALLGKISEIKLDAREAPANPTDA